MADKKIWILVLLLAVLGFSSYHMLTKRAAVSGSQVPEPVPLSPGFAALESFQPKSRPPRSEYAWWGRNPFMKDAMLSLTGIVWDEKTPKAVIQDKILGVGEEIRGNKVLEIHPTRVKMTNGYSEFELQLPVQDSASSETAS